MTIPEQGRLCGIDYGTVRVGVAISDANQTMSAPHELLPRSTPEKEAAYFLKLVEHEQVRGFIVGLPLHISGDESQKSQEAREYGAWLGKVSGVPIEFHDERFTSSLAEDLLMDAGLTNKRRKARRDKLAAHLILSGFLEMRAQDSREGEAPAEP